MVKVPAGAVTESISQAEFQATVARHLRRQITTAEWTAITDDAKEAYDRLRANSPAWIDVKETPRHREILHVQQNPRTHARSLYAVGAYVEDGNHENWIIRWCIRHQFRNREARGSGRTATKGSTGSGTTRGAGGSASRSKTQQQPGQSATYYDPVRDASRRS